MILGPLWRWIGGGLMFLTLILGIALWAERRHSAKLSQRNAELVELRKADRSAYETAQRQAQLNNEKQLQRVQHEQEQITSRVKSDYARDLERLRSQARTAQGAPHTTGASGVPQAAGGADGQTGVPLSTPELLRAAELELQLDRLIDWVNQQSKVDPNK